MTTQLPLIFVDEVVSALISPSTCITRYDGGLPEYVTVATAEQLRRAIELLPSELRSRGVVLEFALGKKLRGMP